MLLDILKSMFSFSVLQSVIAIIISLIYVFHFTINICNLIVVLTTDVPTVLPHAQEKIKQLKDHGSDFLQAASQNRLMGTVRPGNIIKNSSHLS